MNSVLLAALNLVLFLLLSSLLAQSIAQAQWRGRGAAAVMIWIVLCGQVWMVPQAVSFFALQSPVWLAPLWFGNWLASAVGVIVFSLIFRGQSRHLLDAARLDGCGAFGVFRLVVWPTLKPALGVLGLVLVMATWREFAGPLLPAGSNPIGTVLTWSDGRLSSPLPLPPPCRSSRFTSSRDGRFRIPASQSA